MNLYYLYCFITHKIAYKFQNNLKLISITLFVLKIVLEIEIKFDPVGPTEEISSKT